MGAIPIQPLESCSKRFYKRMWRCESVVSAKPVTLEFVYIMSKIVAIARSESAAEKFVLPEPEITFDVDAESGDITLHATFRSVDPDVNKQSKKTIYLARTLNPVDVEFMLDIPEYDDKGQPVLDENGERKLVPTKQVLAVGTQPLQVKVSLSYPVAAEEKKENPDGNGGEEGGDPEDDEV